MTVTLEVIATQLARVLDGQLQMREQLARIEERLERVEHRDGELGDEMTVLTGMVLPSSREPIAWGGVQSQRTRLEERIGRLEQTRTGAP